MFFLPTKTAAAFRADFISSPPPLESIQALGGRKCRLFQNGSADPQDPQMSVRRFERIARQPAGVNAKPHVNRASLIGQVWQPFAQKPPPAIATPPEK